VNEQFPHFSPQRDWMLKAKRLLGAAKVAFYQDETRNRTEVLFWGTNDRYVNETCFARAYDANQRGIG
jgi:hypothetical protein